MLVFRLEELITKEISPGVVKLDVKNWVLEMKKKMPV